MPENTTEPQVAPRMPLTSADVLGGRMEQLRELFPEAFVEGTIDFDRLRNALGDFVGEGKAVRYLWGLVMSIQTWVFQGNSTNFNIDAYLSTHAYVYFGEVAS